MCVSAANQCIVDESGARTPYCSVLMPLSPTAAVAAATIYIINFACELCNHNANNKSTEFFFLLVTATHPVASGHLLFKYLIFIQPFARSHSLTLAHHVYTDSLFFFVRFSFSGDIMTVPDIYGLGNSLSQLNAVSSPHHNGSINNSFGSGTAMTPNSSIGATTPQQINANMPPFSQLTPTSMSSGSFGTPAKNFDSLQVIHWFAL